MFEFLFKLRYGKHMYRFVAIYSKKVDVVLIILLYKIHTDGFLIVSTTFKTWRDFPFIFCSVNFGIVKNPVSTKNLIESVTR